MTAELVLHQKVIDEEGNITLNHHPKGHHRHFRGSEIPYGFVGIDRLIEDFKADIAQAREVKQR